MSVLDEIFPPVITLLSHSINTRVFFLKTVVLGDALILVDLAPRETIVTLPDLLRDSTYLGDFGLCHVSKTYFWKARMRPARLPQVGVAPTARIELWISGNLESERLYLFNT